MFNMLFKKIFLITILVASYFVSIGQFVNKPTVGSATSNYNSKGGLSSDSGFIVTNNGDTAFGRQINYYDGTSGKGYGFVGLNGNMYYRYNGAWVKLLTTGGGTDSSIFATHYWVQQGFVPIQTQSPYGSLSGGGSYELHSSGTFGSTLSWTAGRYAANSTQGATNPLSSIVVAGISQSFSQPSAGSSVSGTQSVTVTYNSNTTYNNVITTTDSKTATYSTSYLFYPKLYIGFVPSNSPSDADIIGVTNGNGGVLATNFIASGSLSTPSASKYICIAYPASFGAVNNIVINGLSVTFNLTTRSFTNASGYSQSYYIYLSPNATAGSVASYSVN